jgi:hypothetical protein
VAEDRRPHRTRCKSAEVDQKRIQRTGQRIVAWEKQLRKHQAGDHAVKKEVVPFDRRADRRRDHRAAKLAGMFGVR